ncbi:MAG: CRISPR-associated endonuclease Cas3'' [bacterium]|jgi:CRISPR-associated endonuclease/helicase Cas3
MKYYGHSQSAGKSETVIEHLRDVAQLAAEFAKEFGAAKEAECMGLLHDIGKYGDLFQERLKNRVRGIDHWSLGAWLMLKQYQEKGINGAVAIQGHHTGLQKINNQALQGLQPAILRERHPQKLRLSEASVEELLRRFRADGGKLCLPDEINASKYPKNYRHKIASMLDIRMLYSVLVDADFVATEAHFNRDAAGNRVYRKNGQLLAPGKCLAILEAYVDDLRRTSKADAAVRSIRDDLFDNCLRAAWVPPRDFYVIRSHRRRQNSGHARLRSPPCHA